MGTQNTENRNSLKRLLDAVPPGYLVDAHWFTSRGIAYETFRNYVSRGWLTRVHRGVFQRPTPQRRGSQIDWRVCLLSIQHIMGYPLHLGSTSALAHFGYEHYLRLGSEAPVWVYGETIPNWLAKLPLNAPVVTRTPSLFSDPDLGITERETNTESGLPWDWPMRMSAPERAILEALDELPHREAFHNIDMIFESLTTLRPKVLAALLKSCNKVKVRRLFFVFADRHRHPWRKRVNPSDFDLGRGDRALVKGGTIHPTYRIVVPSEFAGKEAEYGA